MGTSSSVQTLETVHHISHTHRHPLIDVDLGVCKQLKSQGPMEEIYTNIYDICMNIIEWSNKHWVDDKDEEKEIKFMV